MNESNKINTKDYMKLQHIVLELSERFMYASKTTLDSVVNAALRTLGEAVSSDRVYIFKYNFDLEITDNIYEWCQEGIKPEIDNLQGLPISIISNWSKKHLEGLPQVVEDVHKVESQSLRDVLVNQKIKSLITVPLMIDEECYGFVGFDSVKQRRIFNENETNLLMVFANMLAGVFKRFQLETRLLESEIMLKNVINTIPSRVFWKDSEGVYLGANDAFVRDLGLKSVYDIVGKNDYELSWKEFAESYRKDDFEVMGKDIRRVNYEEKAYNSKGEEIWVSTSKVPLKNTQGKIIGLLGSFDDITEKKKLEEEVFLQQEKLKYENQRFNQLVDSTRDIIFELDTEGRHQSIYSSVLKESNLSQEMVMGKTAVEFFGEKEGRVHLDYAKKALQGKELKYEWESQSDEGISKFETLLSPIYDDKKNVVGVVGVARDVTEKSNYLEQIEHLSYHDYLTDLYNRRYFELKLQEINQKAEYPFSIMIMDLNGLKLFNDAFGHAIGDEALTSVAKVLLKVCDEEAIIARIGGDEFGIILPNTTFESCNEVKRQIVLGVEKVKIHKIELSIAVGYETKNDDTISVEALLKSAEDYMYKRKLIEGKSRQNKAIQTVLRSFTDKYEMEKVHSKRVSRISYRIGKALDLSQDDLEELSLAAMLHDIGKISIPDAILGKPGPLTEDEFNIIKNHTINGYQLLRSADEYSDLAEYALSHHERIDGTGYPKGLKDHEIPLYAKIISIADAYEVMTANRPYREALGQSYAIDELKRFSGTQFDAMLVKLFINDVLKHYPKL